MAALVAAAEGQEPGTLYQSRYLHRYGLLLSGPGEVAADPLDSALALLLRDPGALGVEASDLGELELLWRYTTEHNQVTHLHFRQVLSGIEVFQGRVSVNVSPSGSVLAVGSHLSPRTRERLNTFTPVLSREEAIRLGAGYAGVDLSADRVTLLEDSGGPGMRGSFEAARFSRRPIPVELKLTPSPGGVRLAWSLEVFLSDGSDAFEQLVDAVSGEELWRLSHVARAQPEYDVFPLAERASPAADPVESPAHAPQRRITGGPDPGASPGGWLDTSLTPRETRGNNARAYETVGGSRTYAHGGTGQGEEEHFHYSLSLAELDSSYDPSTYRDAALTNAFYTLNVLHDVIACYGFNEAAGNFQDDNFGRGGIGGDPVELARGTGLGGRLLFQGEGTSPTLQASLDNVHAIAETGYNAPSGASTAVAIAAGDLDILVAHASQYLGMLVNQGPQYFSFSYVYVGQCSDPRGIVATDLDGDGDPDVALVCYGSNNVVLLENYASAFYYPRKVNLLGAGTSIARADLNGDNLPDLVATSSNPHALSVLLATAAFSYAVSHIQLPAKAFPESVAAGDLDGDGDEDVGVALKGLDQVALFANDGAGQLSEVRRVHVGHSPSSVAVAAIEAVPNDPNDLVVANLDSDTISVRLNRSAAKPWLFTNPVRVQSATYRRADLPVTRSPPALHKPRALVVAQLKGDTDLDLAVVSSSGSTYVTVLEGNDQGAFSRSSAPRFAFVRDMSLDNGAVAHEYGHGVGWRLTGDPFSRNMSGYHGNGLSEGTSDFFALALTQTQEPERPRGHQTFFAGEPPEGPGVRTLPYSRDPLVNGLTFGDYNRRRCAAGDINSCPCGSICNSDPSPLQGFHAVGEIWASVLWDVYWTLADLYGRSGNPYLSGFDSGAGGDNIALQLVIDAFKLQPPNPTFLQARDALLLADEVDYGGAHRDLLWDVFAARGMGWNAADQDPAACQNPCYPPYDSEAVIEDFSPPPPGSISGTLREDTGCNGTPGPELLGWYVFVDENKNGIRDLGEPNTYTYYSGTYTFTNLEPGTYIVAVDVKAGWKQTFPAPSLELVAQWNGSRLYADVWGEGNFAYLGHRGEPGVDIIDLALLEADPAEAFVGRWDDGSGGTNYLDVKVENGVAYFASDGGRGVSVVDVTDPFAPRTLGGINAAAGGFDRVHNLSVDGGYVYLASNVDPPPGQDPRVPVFKLDGSGSPQKVRDIYVTGGSGGRIHDVTALRGRVYVSQPECAGGGKCGYVHIFDVSQVETQDPCLLRTIQTDEWTHSAWPTKNDDYLVVAQEPGQAALDNTIEIYRITGIDCAGGGSVSLAATISLPFSEASSAHDPRVVGDLLYVSWYEAGVLLFDISSPSSPVELARFDPYSGPLGFRGVWGVCPFVGPERILASDKDTGLYLLRNQLAWKVTITAEAPSITGKDFLLTRSSTCGN